VSVGILCSGMRFGEMMGGGAMSCGDFQMLGCAIVVPWMGLWKDTIRRLLMIAVCLGTGWLRTMVSWWKVVWVDLARMMPLEVCHLNMTSCIRAVPCWAMCTVMDGLSDGHIVLSALEMYRRAV